MFTRCGKNRQKIVICGLVTHHVEKSEHGVETLGNSDTSTIPFHVFNQFMAPGLKNHFWAGVHPDDRMSAFGKEDRMSARSRTELEKLQ